jgi:hypothetical protein
MNTDKKPAEPGSLGGEASPPQADTEPGESKACSGPPNLCLSVFICGFALHGYS